MNSEEFKGIIPPILQIPDFEESRFEEVNLEEVTIGQAQAYEPLVAGGYIEESAEITYWLGKYGSFRKYEQSLEGMAEISVQVFEGWLM